MEEFKITIIGGGVIGLAVAAELSGRHDGIALVERHGTFGQETSSRNSEVIHAGMYYPEGTLKAKACVEGAAKLYEICAKSSIPHRRIGKLIAASAEGEIAILESLLEKGRKNNVKNLVLLDKAEVRSMEPSVNAAAALYSPDTGIIDSHSLMKHFCARAESGGVLMAFNSEVELLRKEGDWFEVGVRQEDYRFRSKVVINCAGLSSDAIAAMAGIDIVERKYKLRYCKGSYFSYAKPSPVNMLIYPVPHGELAGLGVHATLDLGGRLRFGPDVEYVDALDYGVDPAKKDAFFTSVVKIIPGLEREALVPDMSGLRPKLYGPGEKIRDFVIADESDKGLEGLINLIGIESPGLTASPVIAEIVSHIVDGMEV